MIVNQLWLPIIIVGGNIKVFDELNAVLGVKCCMGVKCCVDAETVLC